MTTVSAVRALKTVGDHEVVPRYWIYSQACDEQNDLVYRSVMDRYKSISLPTAKAPPGGNLSESQSRYFKSFYDSFVYSEKRKFKELVEEIVKAEGQLRLQIFLMEKNCFATLCRSMAPHLKSILPSLMFVNALLPAQAECVARRLIHVEFFEMLKEALIIQEIMHRRQIVLVGEPDERWQIEGAEPTNWIESRKKQVEREEMLKKGCLTLEQERTMEYIIWYSQQQNQISLFVRREIEERMDVERLERLSIGIFSDLFARDLRELKYKHLKYEMSKRCLNEPDVKRLSAEELGARSFLVFEERDRYKEILGLEVKNYLHTRRNVLINERLEISPS